MPSLTSLAEELLAQARKIDAALAQNNLPHPSFDHDTLELLPDQAQKLQRDLADTSYDFQQLVRGPRLAGLDIAFNWTDQLVLRLVWQYKLAAVVPLHESVSYDQISKASNVRRSVVYRVIRAAMPLHIFKEDKAGQVSHTALSRLMKESELYNSTIGLQVEDLGPASVRLIEAWEKADGDQSAFSLANGGRSLFTALTEEPERAVRFELAMRYTVEDKGFDSFNVVKAFDWSSLDKPGAQIVDLGGGRGQISQMLAKDTHHLVFTVQDLPHVVEQGRKALPLDLYHRISFEAHSFLEAQPANSETVPDAFLICRCLHNWNDQQTQVILRALIPALRKGSKVLVWDTVLHDGPTEKLSERFGLQQDLIMATISNGKDRSAQEFRRILEQSDERFRLQSIRRPEGSKLSMIEVSWES